MEHQTQDTSPAIARKRTLRRYYLKHCKDILQKQMTGRSVFLEDQGLRQACLDDPRKIREVAGDHAIVCPGTRNSPCWRIFKFIPGAHLEKHFPGKQRARDFKAHWELPWGFPLTSKASSSKMFESRNGRGPAVDPDVVRPAANDARKKTPWNRLALRSIREKASHPHPERRKISDAQVFDAYTSGLPLIEAARSLGVIAPSLHRRAEKLGLDFGVYHRNKRIIAKVLYAIRKHFVGIAACPTAQQVDQWIIDELRVADEQLFQALIPFRVRLKEELLPEVIQELVASHPTRNRMTKNVFPLVARIIRRSGGTAVRATKAPGKKSEHSTRKTAEERNKRKLATAVKNLLPSFERGLSLRREAQKASPTDKIKWESALRADGFAQIDIDLLISCKLARAAAAAAIAHRKGLTPRSVQNACSANKDLF